MRAVICEAYGPPSSLVVANVDRPVLAADEVRIRVSAAGVNFPDTLIIQGRYQLKPPMPFTPGFEVAGEILEVGGDVDARGVGDRVMTLTSSGFGAFAEEATARARETVAIPDHMDDVTASALYTAYGTAYHALVQRAALKKGETLVVLGATGGVGLAAVEIGVALGGNVIAVGHSEEKLEIARAKGASETIVHVDGELGKTIRALTSGAGADVCLDTAGGGAFDEMSRAMAWDGRLLVVGFTSGVVPNLPVNLPLLKGYALIGVYWGSFCSRSPEANAANFDALGQLYAQGCISPHVAACYPMERASDALDALLSRRTAGKLVLAPFSTSKE